MSGGLDVLQMKEEDVLKFLAAGTHLGGTNLDFQMEQLCKINVFILSSVHVNPARLLSSHDHAEACSMKGRWVAVGVSLCFGVRIQHSVLIFPLLARLSLITEGQELTCSRSWKLWK